MRARLVTALILLETAAMPLMAQRVNPPRGFPFSEATDELRLEQQAQAIPDAPHLRRYMDFLASEPHSAGSSRTKVVADYLLGSLKEWGLAAAIEEFEALIPFPTVRQLEVLSPQHFTAALKEPVVPQDSSTYNSHQLPTFNAYSASGDITADVIYVNYGLPDDYEWLARQGIDVRGKIVINALREKLAWHQTKGSGRTWRRGLSDLFRSAAGWILRRRCLPRRAHASPRRCTARQCPGYAAISG